MIGQPQFQTHQCQQSTNCYSRDFTNGRDFEVLPNRCQFSDLTLKFTKSLAQTSQADSDMRSSQIEDQTSELSSISITKFQLQSQVDSENDLCEQFHEKGYCFNGSKCIRIHLLNINQELKTNKKKAVLKWILKETPELLLDCRTGRISNFLQ